MDRLAEIQKWVDRNKVSAYNVAESHIRYLLSELQREREERQTLIEGLKWYADEDNWNEEDRGIYVIPARMDSGDKARSILQQVGESHE